MKKQQDILDELMQIAPDAKWPADVPFEAPAGYFEQLPEAILQQVRLHTQHTVTPAQANTVQEELEVISPLLASIPRQQPFSLPDHYFETLEIVTPVEMPTMRVVHRKNRLGWFKWAVAACLIGFVGTTALLFIENDKSNSIDRQLEKVSDQDIVDYLQAHTDTFDNETILAGFNESNAAESLQEHLNELSLPAAEKYLQQPYPENEVVPNQ